MKRPELGLRGQQAYQAKVLERQGRTVGACQECGRETLVDRDGRGICHRCDDDSAWGSLFDRVGK